MKKEIFACCLLLAMFAGALLNIGHINNITEQMTTLVEQAGQYAQSGQWELACQSAQQAQSLWQKNDAYAHIVMPHSEIESTADTFYELMKQIYSRSSGGVKGASQAVKARLKDIADRESISLGSIF
jgi:hypothetical protein